VLLYAGGSSGLVLLGGVELDQAAALFGSAVASAGDVNGDGFSDILMGAPYYSNGSLGEGGAFIVLGFGTEGSARGGVGARATSETLLPPGMVWSAESGQADAHTGWAIGSAGDVNGDGFSDVIVATPHFDGGQTDEGRVELFHGNGGGGVDRHVQQRWVDDSRPIGFLGSSESTNAFRVSARGRSAAGRDHVWLEWEVKPTGVPFDGSGTDRSMALDTGAPASGGAVALSGVPSGLELASPHHWRVRVGSPSPFFPRTPWFSIPGNAPTETDVRTAIMSLADVRPGAVSTPSSLQAASPNPFRSSTTITYALDRAATVRLAVFDVLGREHLVLEEGPREAGDHRVSWDGRTRTGGRLAAGVYLVRLRIADRVETRKVILGE
jgi:hypothetical protein